jgi:thiamine-phosphate pyrophosphorylase
VTALAPGLLLITDRGQAVHPLSRIVDAALGAGFAGVLVREKDLDAAPLLEVAAPLAAACRQQGGAFLVSDRIDVALALEGAGAQVGAAGLPVPEARELLGPDRLLGYSAHDAEEAARALAEGADYVTLSPVFASRSKPGYSPRGIRFLEAALHRLPPDRVRALGGIEDPERVRHVRDAGAGGAAIMGALMRAADPETTARSLSEAWRAGEAL